MKSFKIAKKISKKDAKTNLLFWFIFIAAFIVVAGIIFYYYQNTLHAIDAQANSGLIINFKAVK